MRRLQFGASNSCPVRRPFQSPRYSALPRVLSLVAIYTLVCYLTCDVWAQQRQLAAKEEAKANRIVPGELLVKWVKPAQKAEVERLLAESGLRWKTLERYASIGWERVQLPEGWDVQRAMKRLNELSRITGNALQFLPNIVLRPPAPPPATSNKAAPNPPRVSNDPAPSWALAKIGAAHAWRRTTGSADVVVAVLDSGINYRHEDLAANMWRNVREIASNGIDDDKNGYVDDVFGLNAVSDDGNPNDDQGHGTHCAGIIGAVGNNKKGGVGVNWKVQLMALRFMQRDFLGFPAGTTSDAIQCYEYLIAMQRRGVPVRVVSNSWGSMEANQPLAAVIKQAADLGVLSICAAGNERINLDRTPSYPAAYRMQGLISVAASDERDSMAPFSNYGRTKVHIAAPGTHIRSTYTGGNSAYRTLDGTSMAAPFVAGAAALLWARDRNLTVARVRSLLLHTIDPLPQWKSRVSSGGRLNLARALNGLDAASRPQPSTPARPRPGDST